MREEKSEEEVSRAAIASLAFWPYIKEGQNQLYKLRVRQARHASNAEGGQREREEERRERREARRKQLADRRRHKTRRRQETTNGNAISSSSQSQSSIDIGSSNIVFCLSPLPPPLLLNVWQALLLLLRWSSAACQTS